MMPKIKFTSITSRSTSSSHTLPYVFS